MVPSVCLSLISIFSTWEFAGHFYWQFVGGFYSKYEFFIRYMCCRYFPQSVACAFSSLTGRPPAEVQSVISLLVVFVSCVLCKLVPLPEKHLPYVVLETLCFHFWFYAPSSFSIRMDKGVDYGNFCSAFQWLSLSTEALANADPSGWIRDTECWSLDKKILSGFLAVLQRLCPKLVSPRRAEKKSSPGSQHQTPASDWNLILNHVQEQMKLFELVTWAQFLLFWRTENLRNTFLPSPAHTQVRYSNGK